MQRARVVARVNGDGPHPELRGGACDPDGDLSPVGYQDPLHAVPHLRVDIGVNAIMGSVYPFWQVCADT
ncbi:hypothetical protein GCM10010182_33930 [Actinomadura cremea]|nr:hypothetical protein GCM10010182_33930 [Actinomadura cremea]